MPLRVLGKRFLGLSLCVWILLFALIPHSARGVLWPVRAVSGLWERGEAVIKVEDRLSDEIEVREHHPTLVLETSEHNFLFMDQPPVEVRNPSPNFYK